MNLNRLTSSIKDHEGCRLEAYKDTLGVWTIGWGTNLESKFNKKSFQGFCITQATADQWLNEDIGKSIFESEKFTEFKYLIEDARENAFIEMVYNLGPGGVRKFAKFLGAIKDTDFVLASKEMLDSLWAKQVGNRAIVLSEMIKTGLFT